MWHLSGNLKYLRKKFGFGQEEVAEQLGITQSSVSAHELDKSLPTVEVLEKISVLYGHSMDYLLKKDLTISKIVWVIAASLIVIDRFSCDKDS